MKKNSLKPQSDVYLLLLNQFALLSFFSFSSLLFFGSTLPVGSFPLFLVSFPLCVFSLLVSSPHRVLYAFATWFLYCFLPFLFLTFSLYFFPFSCVLNLSSPCFLHHFFSSSCSLSYFLSCPRFQLCFLSCYFPNCSHSSPRFLCFFLYFLVCSPCLLSLLPLLPVI